jgi:TonB family protein
MKNNLFVWVLSLFIGSIKAQYSTPSVVNAEDSVWVDQDSIFSIHRGQKAQFKGGEAEFQKYITKNFRYPTRCQDKGIRGSVVLRFVVEMDGSISNVRVIEGTAKCPEFAQEAVRVLKKSPRWIPGIYNGQYVKSYRELPLRLSVE